MPKRPESVPLLDKENASFMIDGEMVSVPLPLFKKLFIEEQEVDYGSMLIPLTKDLKDNGISKDMMKMIMGEVLGSNNMLSSKDKMNSLLDELFD